MYVYKRVFRNKIKNVDKCSQLAKFSGPTAGSHRQFDRSADGSCRRSESGSAKRRDGGLLAANGRRVAAARQKAAFTSASPRARRASNPSSPTPPNHATAHGGGRAAGVESPTKLIWGLLKPIFGYPQMHSSYRLLLVPSS